MAVERRNPLPAGRYWVDVFETQAPAFRDWLFKYAPSVRVVTTEHFSDTSPTRDWYLFTVTSPTPWSGPGLPTIADPSVTTSEDTSQRPAPEPLPSLTDAVQHVAMEALEVVAVISAVFVIAKLLKKGKSNGS